MNMNAWLSELKANKITKAMPVLSFPGSQIIKVGVDKLVQSGELQAQCMKAIADRYDTLAALSLMDLSVEAEAFGADILFSDDEVPTVVGKLLESEDDIKNLQVPKVGDKRTGEYVKTIEHAAKLITDRPILAGAIGPFSLSGRLLDMTEIMVMSITDPELVHQVLSKATEFIISYIGTIKAAGANGVVIAEPAAGLLSPDLNAEFSVPYVKQVVDALQDESFMVVYHNCGNTIPLINDILKIGAKVLHFGNAVDMTEMMPLIPDDIFASGNVDPSSKFRNGTRGEVIEATQKLLESCAKYPNFIPSSGCDIPPATPLENIDAFFEVIADFYK